MSLTTLDDNPYVELTAAFNRECLRAVLSSGQAVVLHRLAVMSKDGDWILRERENEERLAIFQQAMQPWAEIWPEVSAEVTGLPLLEAHAIVVERAEGVLPWAPPGLEKKND